MKERSIGGNRIARKAAGRLTVVLALVLANCAVKVPIRGHVPSLEGTTPPFTQDLSVGAARVDLTPIPGVSMNYSMDGYLSRGFWTRLYSRVIFIQHKHDTIVLVSSDLPHIPNGLGDRIAENLSKIPDLAGMDAGKVVLAATHTHHGPENWFSSAMYNAFPSPRPGFDPQLFEFIAERITTGIHRAFLNMKKVSKVEVRTAKLRNMFRNRSVEPFLLNPDAQDFLEANTDTVNPEKDVPETCVLAEGRTNTKACRAVHAEVDVVDFKDSLGKRITSAVFLATHATVMSVETELFSGDLYGVAASLVEQGSVEGCESYDAPVVALFNGAQGDVSPTWKERNRYELVGDDPGCLDSDPTCDDPGLAVRLAKFICNKKPTVVATDIQATPLKARFGWLNLEEPLSATDKSCEPRHEKCTERQPQSGIPSAGGAQDGRTFFYELGLQEGLRSESRAKHGRKVLGLNALGANLVLSSILSAPDAAPNNIPIGLYQMGELVLVPLAGEFTTMMGHRIRKAVEARVGGGARALLVGLANGHLSYVTTPEEYDAQYYEGAQNLYGAATGPVIQKEILKLVSSNDSPTRVKGKYEYETGECRVAMPRDIGEPPYNKDEGLQNILMSLSEPDVLKRDFTQQCWVDAIPALPKTTETYAESSELCERAVPYVWMEKTSNSQCTPLPPGFLVDPCERHPKTCVVGDDPRHCINDVPQDNCGLDLVTTLNAVYYDRTRWCSFFMPRNGQVASDYKTCVTGVTGTPVTLLGGDAGDPFEPFDIDHLSTLQQMLTTPERNRNECADLRTRPVCVFPQ